MTPPKILCAGITTFDNIFRVDEIPTHGTKIRATGLVRTIGGMSANAAIAVARLGGQASLWTRIGDDQEGARVRDDLREEGVDTRHVASLPGAATPVAAILIDAAGERLACPYFDPALGDDATWLPLARIGDYDLVMADVRWPTVAAAVLGAARAAGVPTLLDADIAPPDTLRDLAERADYPVFSRAAVQCLGHTGDIAAAAASLAAQLPGTVGVTDGAAGCVVVTADGPVHVPAFTVTATDTLAAGDVFHGAFALAVAEGRSVTAAARFANIAAALKCRHFGGIQGAPRRAEVDAVLAGP